MVLGAIIGILIASIFNMIIIFIVGKLKLGMEVKNLGTAFLAALIIGILTVLIGMAVDPVIAEQTMPGWVKYIINFLISAVVIYLAGKMLKGMTTQGFSGAIVAAIAIALITWLIDLLLSGVVN